MGVEIMNLVGKVSTLGSALYTDAIIPARYLNTSDPVELARHCMEDADPDFPKVVQQGDIIVADKNFGCGSSREHAPIAIKAAGVSLVIARSFARIFYRNSVNIGLPILECPDCIDEIKAGDQLEVDLIKGEIKNTSNGKTYQAEPFPSFMQGIMDKGGLIEYVRERVS